MAKSRIPTRKNLERHPMAVVIWEVLASDPENEFIKEFDWFDNQKQVSGYLDEVVGMMTETVKEQTAKERTYFLVAAIKDTKTLSLSEIRVVHTEATKEAGRYCEQWAERVNDDPSSLLVPEDDGEKKRRVGSSEKVAAKKVEGKEQPKRTVKGRRPSAAVQKAAVAPSKDVGPTATRRSTKPRAKVATTDEKKEAVKAQIKAKDATPTPAQDKALDKVAEEIAAMALTGRVPLRFRRKV